MLAFLGDIHGSAKTLRRILNEVIKYPDIKALIQVGDFGWYSKTIEEFRAVKPEIPVYWIDGNHEQFPLMRDWTQKQPTEMAENIFFVPRGLTLELDGRKILFFGGAGSVDKKFRLQLGWHWYDEENIRDHQLERVNRNERVDLMITHVPPQSVIQRNFDPNALLMFDLPPTWVDENAVKIETLWNEMGCPPLICGHMHRSVVDGNCRILNIDELYCL